MSIQMQSQPLILLILAMLLWGPESPLAQGRGHRFGTEGGTGHQNRPTQGMESQVQAMAGLLLQMSERIKAGPLTPDQALHLSGMLEQLATIMNKMAAGIPGVDVASQLEGMKARLAEMQPQATP
jgi:hypothetical protein